MAKIEVQKGSYIKIHGSDPTGKCEPYDIFYKVKAIKSAGVSPAIFGFKGPAIDVDLLMAVTEKTGWPSHSGEFIPRDWYNPDTKTARIESESRVGRYTTITEVVNETDIPVGLIFMDR